MDKKARAPRDPQSAEELVAAIAAKNANLRKIRKENGELVAAFKKNTQERKNEIAAREAMVKVLNGLKAEKKAAAKAKKAAVAKKAAKKTEPKKPVAKKVPMKKKVAKKPAKLETPETLMTELNVGMEIF